MLVTLKAKGSMIGNCVKSGKLKHLLLVKKSYHRKIFLSISGSHWLLFPKHIYINKFNFRGEVCPFLNNEN